MISDVKGEFAWPVDQNAAECGPGAQNLRRTRCVILA